MSRQAGPGRERGVAAGGDVLAEDSPEDLFDHAPCGYLATRPDGLIVMINATLLRWLGRSRDEVVGRLRFADLLTVGGRIYHETHVAPLLRMQGEVGGLALEMRTAGGARLPVLTSSALVTDPAGRPLRIRTAVFAAHDRRDYERELLRARQEADRDRDRVQRLAATLQRSLLPPVLPDLPGAHLAAHYHPASVDQVGGDFYDVFPLPGGRWALFMGDVCGKGAEAAAVTSLARYALRTAAVHDPDPVAVLRTLNTVLRQERLDGERPFCTVLTALLTPGAQGWDAQLAAGGHPPALLLGADGTARYLHTSGGQLLGALREPRFVATSARLRAGDTLLLYTDGLPEARTGPDRSRFDEDTLLEFAGALAPTGAAGAVAAVRELLATFGEGLDDDVAVLAVGVAPVSRAPVPAAGGAPPAPPPPAGPPG